MNHLHRASNKKSMALPMIFSAIILNIRKTSAKQICPTFEGMYITPQAWDVKVLGNYAYVTDSTRGLLIIDKTNISNPFLIGFAQIRGNQYLKVNHVAVTNNFAYISSWEADYPFQIVNITDPSNPTFVGGIGAAGTFHFSGVAVLGNYAYVLSRGSYFRSIDISNPSGPSIFGSCTSCGSSYRGNIVIFGNRAYVATGNELQIIDISSPINPVLLGSSTIIGRGLAVAGSLVYVADSINGLKIFDVSNPASPALIQTFKILGYATDVVVSGNFAIISTEFSGVKVVDITNPLVPFLVGSYDTPGIALNIDTDGTYIYVADYNWGLQILNTNCLLNSTSSFSSATSKSSFSTSSSLANSTTFLLNSTSFVTTSSNNPTTTSSTSFSSFQSSSLDKSTTFSEIKIPTSIDIESSKTNYSQKVWLGVGIGIGSIICLELGGLIIYLIYKKREDKHFESHEMQPSYQDSSAQSRVTPEDRESEYQKPADVTLAIEDLYGRTPNDVFATQYQKSPV